MTDSSTTRTSAFDRITTRITRRGLAKAGGLSVAGAMLGGTSLLKAAAQNEPNVANVINTSMTFEAFMVTFYGAVRGLGKDLALDDDVTRFVRAAQCEEEAHYHYFEAVGAVPSTTTFTIDTSAFTDQAAFLAALAPLESASVGMYMAAARRFSAAGNAPLVEIAYQIGAVEAQHLAVMKLYSGEKLGADRAFAKWMFHDPADAITILTNLGYIGGGGEKTSFPGPIERYCRGVSGLVAETTEDQPAPTPTPLPTVPPTPTGVAG